VRNGQVGGCPGARIDVWESEALRSDPVNGPIHKLIDKARLACVPPPYPPNLRFDEMQRELTMGLDPLWTGASTPEELIPELAKRLQATLDKPMA